MLKITEIFKSIQGEGPYTGHPAIFIRLAGCNMEPVCSFCDTDFTVKREMTVEQIREEVDQLSAAQITLVVITGGEPFAQDLRELIDRLYKYYIIQIETNGSILPITYDKHNNYFNFWEKTKIVVSPKALPVESYIYRVAAAVKFVVKAGMKPCIKDYDCPVYVQPMDEKDPVKNKANQDWAVKLCLEHGYKLSLQLHKILDIQ